MTKGEGWWIGFSEDDASIAERARFIWRQNRIVCQRVEDNAFHLVYQLSAVPESVESVNGAAGSSDTEGKAAKVAASETGAERVSNPWFSLFYLVFIGLPP